MQDDNATYTDYTALMNSQDDDLTELFDDEMSITGNLTNLINESLRFTDRALLQPIVTAYLMLPSAITQCLPYLACVGQAGSGKSTIGMIAAGLHGLSTLQGNATFASLRTWVDKNSFWDGQGQQPKNCALVWDDINSWFLRDTKMYSFLKSGYSRKTSITTIMDSDGQVKSFHTFCPKILSTIEPFYLKHEFTEIVRRLVIIPTQRMDKIPASGMNQYDIELLNSDLIDIKSCDMKQYKYQFFQFWQQKDICKEFIELRTLYSGRKKPFKLPKNLKGNNWELCPDLLACGIVTGLWGLEQGLHILDSYFGFKDNVLLKNVSILSTHLSQFIAMHTALSGGAYIVPQSLKDDLNLAMKRGELDRYPTIEVINTEMLNLGYRLDKIGTVTAWVPIVTAQ